MVRYLIILSLIAIFLSACSEFVLPTATETGPVGENKSDITPEDGRYYTFGGDMVLDMSNPRHTELIKELKYPENAFEQNRLNKSSGVRERFIDTWPSGRVYWRYAKLGIFADQYPYNLYEDFSDAEKRLINAAMDSIESVCAVNFIQVNTSHSGPTYLLWNPKSASYRGKSTIGYQDGPYCKLANGFSTGTAIHEFMHGLGFSHEHQRHDRDDYISIYWNNIDDDYKHNFDKIPDKILFVTYSYTYGLYDYNSIMHYDSYAFSKNGSKTIDSKGITIGQRNGLSHTDKYSLRSVYGR